MTVGSGFLQHGKSAPANMFSTGSSACVYTLTYDRSYPVVAIAVVVSSEWGVPDTLQYIVTVSIVWLPI